MEKLKKVLLIGFVFAGVVLVLIVWVQGINDTTSSGAAYQPSATTTAFMTLIQTKASISIPSGTPIFNQQDHIQTLVPPVSPIQQSTPTQIQTPNATQTWIANGYSE